MSKQQPIRVLVITQYFWPENFRINDLVSSLVDRGFDVTVLTGKPNYPEGRIFKGYKAIGSLLEFMGKVFVVRVPIFPRGQRSAIRLAINYFSFVLSGVLMGPWLLRNIRPNIIMVYCPSPIFQALPALLIGRIKRVPVITYVQDLWPESLEATGYVQSRVVLALVRAVVKFIYRHSDLILVSSQSFIDSVRHLAPIAPIAYYPNSVDDSFCDSSSVVRINLPVLEQKFCIVFAGNVGSAQAVHVIVDAAERLLPHQEINIVILGSGSKLEWMRMEVARRRITNLHILGRFPVDSMPFILAKASALLVTLADKPIFAATVPNKIQAYLAVGRPIIACMNGEGARLITEASAGIAVKAEDSVALSNAILDLYSMPDTKRACLGMNAQAYYRKNFNHEKLVTELIEHMNHLIGKFI